MNPRTLFLTLPVTVFGALMVAATAQAQTNLGAYPDSSDVWITGAGPPGGFDDTTVLIMRFVDANGDGDLRDVGDFATIYDETILNAATSCPTTGNVIACDLNNPNFADPVSTFQVKGGAPTHTVGDYTMNVEWLNNIGVELRVDVYSWRVTNDSATSGDVAVIRDQHIAQNLNDTGHNVTMVTQHTNTDTNHSSLTTHVWYPDNMDAHFGVNRSFSPTNPSSVTINLRQFKDANDDGDLADGSTEERTVVNVPTATDCSAGALNAHFSCEVTLGNPSRIELIWKNADPDHTLGNYSLDFIWTNGATTLGRDRFVIGLINPVAGGGIVNTTTINQEVNPVNVLDQQAFRAVFLFALIGGIVWAGIQPSKVLPLLSFFLSVGFVFLILSYYDAWFTARIVTDVLASLGIMALPIGPVNLLFQSKRSRRMVPT